MIDHPYKGKEIRRKGGRGTDEVFTLSNVGMLNITKLGNFLFKRPELFRFVESTLTGETVDNLRATRDIDPIRLAQLTERDLDESFAVGVEMDGSVEVIDGNHYIIRSWQLGRRTFRIALMPQRLIPQFLVRFEVKLNGRWKPITPEEILAVTEGKYGGADGNLRNRQGEVIAHVPSMKTAP